VRQLSLRTRRIAAAALGVLAVALGAAVLAFAPGADDLPEGGVAVAYIGVTAAWGFVAAGGFAWLRRPDNRTGPLMIAVGLATLTAGLQFSDAALPFVLGGLCDTLIIALLVHLLLAFPSGRLAGRATLVTATAGYVTATVLHAPQVLLGDEHGLADAPGVVDVLAALELAVELAVLLATVVLLARRRRAASRVERRGLDPVLLLGAVIVALGGAFLVVQDKPTQLAFLSAFALLPGAFVLGLVRSRFFRTAARLIEGLAADHGAAGVRDALRAALGDPTLAVAYWLPEEERYVDGDGGAIVLPPPGDGRAVTEIDHSGRRVGALVHAAALRDEPELLGEAASTAALAIENGRLEVELRARVEALRASRARIVEAGDAERRRLTRDLHDGAQQRLVSLKIDLQLARERVDEPAARELLDRAVANADAAVGELRDLASGIHPAVLAQRGLDAAIEALATRSPVPVEFETQLAGRLPSAVETAAYFVIAEALTNVAKYAGASYARVDVRRAGAELVVEVADDGAGGAVLGGGSGLRGLADRVGALDGSLEVESAPGVGTLVRARLPLAPDEGEDG
jgi:signal transduction histidine kinase